MNVQEKYNKSWMNVKKIFVLDGLIRILKSLVIRLITEAKISKDSMTKTDNFNKAKFSLFPDLTSKKYLEN